MIKRLVYLTIFATSLPIMALAQAQDDLSAALFGPAPKIVAPSSPKESLPLVAKVEVKNESFNEAATPPPPAFDAVENNSANEQETIENDVTTENTTLAEKKESDSLIAGTWVEQLAKDVVNNNENDSDFLEDEEVTLENMIKSNGSKSLKSNASVFDISGVMLRMSLTQVNEIMKKRGYKLISQKYEIPNFIKWRMEENCRNAGVVGYGHLANCVVKAAQAQNHQYVSSAKYSKFDSKEELEVFFTSNFTGNKVYKIIYHSAITDTMRGTSAKIKYLRDVKIFDFWKRVNQKYGVPDNKADATWGMGGNKPYMKASNGFLLLEDPTLKELDYTRMSREDQKFLNTDMYNF